MPDESLLETAADRLRSAMREMISDGAADERTAGRGRAGEPASGDRPEADAAVPQAGSGSGSDAREPEPPPAADGGGTIVDASVPPAVDASMLPDEDAGDDSDAGVDPEPVEAGVGGSGGAGASGVGGEGAGGEAGASPVSGADRQMLIDLLDVTITVLQASPQAEVGDLLAALASAPSATPDLLARVLQLVARTGGCDPRSELCVRACSIADQRCAQCVTVDACLATLRDTCGPEATACE